jgi:hypothetical protein
MPYTEITGKSDRLLANLLGMRAYQGSARYGITLCALQKMRSFATHDWRFRARHLPPIEKAKTFGETGRYPGYGTQSRADR